ncbi:hypothetical protein N7448_008219 [Penicillium atrosanguineum]|uniref:Beta-lactamase-related domain-containing protein n=1 Tax=Penicillium atrosanguineum TaxID=1132637 RepID=A0A9W9KZ82_9EURO|nr:uncharacterized protein N7443_000766 [Penicillium atrosanguineum]KAJ5127440.1 hypothetical protein N7448_008219 [Penicillium atrosanguineum]KAJ5147644.1 hypothetical protein N7526_000996 [Penicillium atrosanguineum]KAJ5313882.1 hypothetical protein N7443_000766 [Penicillium atrosanguineum]KAJ5331053.1 hypothetical protein N7476_000836 [Penicillium atrosanguineum]
MHIQQYFVLLLSLYATASLADYLGPTYPAPIDLTSPHSLVPVAWKNLTNTFDSYLKHHLKNQDTIALEGVENITFSAGLFSIHDPRAKKLQYHYTSQEILNATNGTHNVDGDSIYRIASATKLFTVYAGMLALTEEEWNRPLTEINKAFAAVAEQGDKDPIWHVQWDKITPWALASQSSGIPREGWPFADSLWAYLSNVKYGLPSTNPVTEWGMPPVNASNLGACWNTDGICYGQDAIKSVRSQPPVFLPWSTPMYANDNFMMLGLMMSNITGHTIEDIYQTTLFEPLGLKSTFASVPTSRNDLTRSVIVGAPESGFAILPALSIPSGGIFSSINDLAKFGISILNNTLLSDNTTRKWMKPSIHTASLTYSMGAPWEIIRYIHPSTGKITDLYTKLGDSGYYGSNIVLIPEYGAGFSIINAGTTSSRGDLSNIVLDYITTTILPIFEAQAALEATKNYIGTYVSSDPNLNSSLTIAFNKSRTTPHSGLTITQWISNGTDVLNTKLFAGLKPRLLPSISKQTPDGAKGQVAFQASLVNQLYGYFAPGAAKMGVIGPFTGQYATNYDWLITDATHYAGKGTNLFVFDVDAKGRAGAVWPAAARVRLVRR